MRRLYADMRRQQSGQTLVEYAVLYIGVIVPLTFGILYLAQMLWVWHSVVDFTRDGARYASTHCWQSDGQNVISYMQSHVPLMIDMDQFQQGQAVITVNFYAADPTSGELTGFSCGSGDCTVDCLPDAVTVSISQYQFARFQNFLGLPPVVMPNFQATLPIESNGCDPEQGVCLP
jgi:TadE-like protein